MESFADKSWTRRAALFAPLFLAACAAEPPTPALNRRALDATRLDRDAALAWLNAYRAKAGLRPVALDPELNALAERQAQAMAEADKVSHDVIGGFSTRLAASSVKTQEAGENVCAGYFSTQAAMQAWADSPEHDANLRLRSATRFGVALAKNPASQWGAFWAMAVASDAA
jgi:uncharacterized protein YkwD